MKGKRIFLLTLIAQLFIGGAFAAASCDSGKHVVSNVAESTFAAPVGGVCQFSGYSILEIPDDFGMIYNGFIVGSAITPCDGHVSGGSCVPYEQGVCENDNYNLAVVESTFAGPVNGVCQFSGYSIKEVPEELTPVYNGFILGNAITLCDGHVSNGSCVSNSPTDGSGACISGYYDLGINTNTFKELTNDTCTSPYSAFTQTTRCDRNPGDTCVDLPTPTISLTWLNEENTVETGACYYGETISLPETIPTRPGYNFAGWKLVTTP